MNGHMSQLKRFTHETFVNVKCCSCFMGEAFLVQSHRGKSYCIWNSPSGSTTFRLFRDARDWCDHHICQGTSWAIICLPVIALDSQYGTVIVVDKRTDAPFLGFEQISFHSNLLTEIVNALVQHTKRLPDQFTQRSLQYYYLDLPEKFENAKLPFKTYERKRKNDNWGWSFQITPSVRPTCDTVALIAEFLQNTPISSPSSIHGGPEMNAGQPKLGPSTVCVS